MGLHRDQQRVAAGHEQDDGGQLEVRVLEEARRRGGASRWFTATNGTSHTSASAFAELTPTSREPTRPGPVVAATASMSAVGQPASTSAWAITGVSSSTWARLAISGTTPP